MVKVKALIGQRAHPLAVGAHRRLEVLVRPAAQLELLDQFVLGRLVLEERLLMPH
jgi:hypothetical protein